MIKKKFLQQFVMVMLCLVPLKTNAQYSNKIWSFGDSAGINFNLTSAPTYHHLGIWTQNSPEVFLTQNDVINGTPLSESNDYFNGFEFDDCDAPSIACNTINNVGYGMLFRNSTANNATLMSNYITEFDNGIYVDNADIGVQGNNSFGFNNNWASTNGNYRVEGTTASFGVINWYHYGSSTGNPLSPLPSRIVQSKPFRSNTGLECADIEPPEPERDIAYGDVIGDSAVYIEEFETELKYMRTLSTFKMLKRHPLLLAVNSETDESFNEFYSTIRNGSIGIIDSSIDLIHLGQKEDANSILQSISVTGVGANLKNVLIKYLSKQFPDSVYSSNDSLFFHNLAIQRSLIAGKATYTARNILFEEVHDTIPIVTLRKSKYIDVFVTNELLTAYPNPANDFIIIKQNENLIGAEMVIYDITGRKAYSEIYKNRININFLEAGLYTLEVRAINGKIYNAKFVKVE